MTRTTRRMPRVAAVVPALAVAAALLTGCGPAQAGSAAVVDGRRITEGDVQTATQQIKTLPWQADPPGQSTVLDWMIVAPYVIETASKYNAGISEQQVRDTLAKTAPDPSDAAVIALRGYLAIQQIVRLEEPVGKQARDEVSKRILSVPLRVNPRFGVFDPKTIALTPETPNWLVEPKTPVDGASTSPDGTQPAPTATP